MEFNKYTHIERYGTTETEGIENGKCYIFYKIDGTNASIWLGEDGQIYAGSRNRELTLNNDNAGFYAAILQDERIKRFFKKYPQYRLFGEWLVKHSLKTYRDDAWKKFYIFDVALDIPVEYKNDVGEIVQDINNNYLSYDKYQPILEEFGLEYIPPLAIAKNPSYEYLINCLEKTGQFLVKDGEGKGEGIVIKNYDYYNRYGRMTYGKIICNEFKEIHHKTMGVPETEFTIIEEKIIEKFCTEAFIEKEYQKIVNNNSGWSSKFIPQLLGRIYHEFIKEESFNFIKEFKNPTINFKTLNCVLINKIKQVKSDLF